MKFQSNILIVDDDQDVLHTARMILKRHFTNVETIADPKKIIELMTTQYYDVVVLDMNFSFGKTSGVEGLQWLKKIKELSPDTQVLMNTAYGDILIAVEAMKEGAADFLVKPWEGEKLTASVRTLYELGRVKKENKNLKEIKHAYSNSIDQQFGDIISESKAMLPVFEMIRKVAVTEANILILGENGTGKELIAREIHKQSDRAAQEFISVDLGAIPEALFESELFGYKKGAFTDAKDDRMGRIEMANNGTLFLDEIGNMSYAMQVKLLSVLQNREIFRVGSSVPIPINIRLICATNNPIYQMIAKGEFRQDLLYRINTVEINLPPLRHRVEDIPLLVNYFQTRYQLKYRKSKQKFSKGAIKKMMLYDWPGNVRELQHFIERTVILNDDELIKEYAITLNLQTDQNTNVNKLNISSVEKDAILKALRQSDGKLNKAAEILGWGRSTLYRKMKKYEL